MVLTEKQNRFRIQVREFAEKEVQPKAVEMDRAQELSMEIIKKMGRAGLFGVWVPKKLGGLGLDSLSYIIAIEEISRVCASSGVTLAAHASLPMGLLYHVGSKKQKKKYLIPMVKGEMLGGFGLTEASSGSDAVALKTHAEKKGDKYILNGSKMFITNANHADLLLIAASTDLSKGSAGISAFIVEKDSPGFSVSKKLSKMGWRGSDTCELIFDNCEVPAENLLGEEGEGFKSFLKVLDGGRIGVGAMAVGIAQGALDECLKYVKKDSRKAIKNIDKELEIALLYSNAWNGKLADQQSIQFTLADFETQITIARNMIYAAATLKDLEQPFKKEAAIAKLFASEMGMRVVTKAIDLMAPESGTEALPFSRFFRDMKATEIGEGTSEIQRLVIARELLKQI